MAKIIKYRDAATGEYVTEEYAKANPDTTVSESEYQKREEAKPDAKEAVIAADDSVTTEPVKVLEPYQQRVVDEKTELDKKLAALAAFQNTETHAALPREERDRLIRQRRYMEQYSAVLGERIAAFNS